MRIAFYAPLKPPDNPVPSGDRRMARLLMAALRRAGHRVDLASRFRAYDGAGDPVGQARLGRRGAALAARYLAKAATLAPSQRPDLWFTYHLYHKAPDWIGPAVARALGIPYAVAEASFAPKRAGGPWDAGHRAVADALAGADLVVNLNPVDSECVAPLLKPGARLLHLAPFVDPTPFARAAAAREAHRRALAAARNLNPAVPWLLCVAMMRPGDKLASYHTLGQALGRLGEAPWALLVAGDGPARDEVAAALAPVGDRVRRLGQVAPGDLPALYAAADIYVWPAVNEAYGMAFLEAQAAGLPVVAGAAGGVPQVVAHCETGLLTPVGDAAAFAGALARLISGPALRNHLGQAAARRVAEVHGLAAAAAALDGALGHLAAGDGP